MRRAAPTAALILLLAAAAPAAAAPATLAETGLYEDPLLLRVAPDLLPFAPQYPLWADGATKRRWIRLPPGAAIDGSDPDVWDFPAGTRIWKEFAFSGRPVETRYMERLADGSWDLATYVWSEDGTSAALAPARGIRGVRHDIPSRGDCLACHGAGRTPVLGFSALQLSPDRDPLAPHAEPPPPGAVDLDALVGRGLLRGFPRLSAPPRVAAATPVARAAMGYLHGNCGGCHDARGELGSLGMDLTQRIRPDAAAGPLATAVSKPARWNAPLLRIAPGDPDASAVVMRMSTRFPAAQMPPLGTHAVDDEAVRLVRAWVAGLRPQPGPEIARAPTKESP